MVVECRENCGRSKTLSVVGLARRDEVDLRFEDGEIQLSETERSVVSASVKCFSGGVEILPILPVALSPSVVLSFLLQLLGSPFSSRHPR